MLKHTPIDELSPICDSLRTTFRSGITKPLSWRRHQLLQLARLAQDNAEALANSLFLDLGRPKQEALMAEVGPIVRRAILCSEKLEEWAAPEDKSCGIHDWQKTWRPRVVRAPIGVALIIAPWNYPIILCLQPLLGAISAGCCAVVKLSEFSPHCSSLLAELLPKYLDSSAYRVVNGTIPEVTRLLELRWDHIFYTGNGAVARIISTAAAKHLTPTTLELGGKSPVILDPAFDVDLAAKRIIWGKNNNCGQICISPDYILATPATVPRLVSAFKNYLKDFFPDGALNSDSYSRIVNDAHFQRLKNLLARTSGKVVVGGEVEEADVAAKNGRKAGIEPTVLVDVKLGDVLLEEEIFGPILPIVEVESIDAAIDFVNNKNEPLVLYVFTDDEAVKEQMISNTRSGNLVFNDTFQQLSVESLPFGGVGESGHGRQILKYTFDAFSYERAVVDIPKEFEQMAKVRYPPYTEQSLDFMSASLKMKIPDSKAPQLVPKLDKLNK